MPADNHFYLNKVYPDAANVFSEDFKKPEEIIKEGIVILDTNILLVPFVTSEKSVTEIKRIYSQLKQNERLFIPARVAREFAKNRALKISEVFLSLRQIQGNFNSGHFSIANFPLLEKNPNYEKLNKVFDTIKNEIKESRKYLQALEDDIQSWTWDDIVSQSYKEIFTPDTIIELQKGENEIIEDLKFRIQYKIAPGFKDSEKIDDGIGDLIIWQTVLEIAKDKDADILFVTNDQKNDWFYKQDKTALYPRHELFDEFRRFTGGKSISIVNFVKFLELSNANTDTIKDIEKRVDAINTIEKNDESINKYKRAINFPDISPGTIIEHFKFGIGRIEKIDGGNSGKILIVNFMHFGRKSLLARFAMIKILDSSSMNIPFSLVNQSLFNEEDEIL